VETTKSARRKEYAMTGRIDEFDGVALLTPIPADDIAVSICLRARD